MSHTIILMNLDWADDDDKAGENTSTSWTNTRSSQSLRDLSKQRRRITNALRSAGMDNPTWRQYYTKGSYDTLLIVSGRGEGNTASLAQSLKEQMNITGNVEIMPAYESSEIMASEKSSTVPGVQVDIVDSLLELRRRCAGRDLIEHTIEENTGHLDDYPTAITHLKSDGAVGEHLPLSLGSDGTLSLDMADNVYAVGFGYQQSLNPTLFEIDLDDNSQIDFMGEGYLPSTSFFGIISKQPIRRLSTDTPTGSFYLVSFHFFASSRHTRRRS